MMIISPLMGKAGYLSAASPSTLSYQEEQRNRRQSLQNVRPSLKRSYQESIPFFSLSVLRHLGASF